VAIDSEGLAAARYDATAGTFYLLRPDQHICARWRRIDASRIEQALARALCMQGSVQ
jgi:3-(3-hydroxy-phenyl)propionate hydroxylase